MTFIVDLESLVLSLRILTLPIDHGPLSLSSNQRPHSSNYSPQRAPVQTLSSNYGPAQSSALLTSTTDLHERSFAYETPTHRMGMRERTKTQKRAPVDGPEPGTEPKLEQQRDFLERTKRVSRNGGRK